MKNWTLNDIAWDRFDPAKVDPDLLKIAKAAANVEANAGDYASYLCGVFDDDPAFQTTARQWAKEEVQHGHALGRWAEIADSSYNFAACFAAFRASYPIDITANRSIRGSRVGELVSRCIVEVGTSSYYSALAEAADEPVFKSICQNIAADELRHYKLFYTHLKRWLKRENIGRWARVFVALKRIHEAVDDELGYAYYTANGDGKGYDRRKWVDEYLRRATRYYRLHHIQRGVAMMLKAVGLEPWGRLNTVASYLVLARMKIKVRSHRLAA